METLGMGYAGDWGCEEYRRGGRGAGEGYASRRLQQAIDHVKCLLRRSAVHSEHRAFPESIAFACSAGSASWGAPGASYSTELTAHIVTAHVGRPGTGG